MSNFYKIRNQTENNVDISIYGDIVSEKEPDFWTGKVSETDIDLLDFKESLDNLSPGGGINLYINSGGGSVFAASTMISMLKRKQQTGSHIKCYIDGLAASAASFFPMVADETFVYKNSMLMIHKPLMFNFGLLNALDLRKAADELDTLEEGILIPLYEDKAKISIDTIIEYVDAETWLTSKDIMETFDFTFVDEEKQIAACASQFFGKYMNTPKDYSQRKTETVTVNEKDELIKPSADYYTALRNKINEKKG